MGDVSISIQRIKLNNTMDFSCPPSPPPCQYIFPSYFIKCQQVNSSHAGTSVSQKGNVHISLAPLNSEHHQGCVKVTKEARGRGHFLRKTPFGQRGRKITGVFIRLQHLAARVSGAVFQVLRCLLDASSETGHSNERRGCQIYTFRTKPSFLEV